MSVYHTPYQLTVYCHVQVPRRVVTQAIFKKAQKAVKAAPQKAQSAVKSAQSATKKLQRQAPAPLKKAQSAAKKVQRQAPSPIKKAQSALKSGSKRTKGWLGGAGGAQDLDKWYGACASGRSAVVPRLTALQCSLHCGRFNLACRDEPKSGDRGCFSSL